MQRSGKQIVCIAKHSNMKPRHQMTCSDSYLEIIIESSVEKMSRLVQNVYAWCKTVIYFKLHPFICCLSLTNRGIFFPEEKSIFSLLATLFLLYEHFFIRSNECFARKTDFVTFYKQNGKKTKRGKIWYHRNI